MRTEIVLPAGEPKKNPAAGKRMSLFGQSIPFAQAFPMLVDLKATVWVRPCGLTEENPPEQCFTLGNPPPEHMNCPKSGCTNGGWPMGDIIRDMIAKRETHRRAEGKCRGRQWVAGPKYQDCVTQFTAEIELAYKPDAGKEANTIAPGRTIINKCR
jgi:hypothetical protein